MFTKTAPGAMYVFNQVRRCLAYARCSADGWHVLHLITRTTAGPLNRDQARQLLSEWTGCEVPR